MVKEIGGGEVADRMKSRMRELGLTQEKLAARLGVHQSRVSKWLRGVKPSADNLRRIAGALDVSADYLLHSDDPEWDEDPEPRRPEAAVGAPPAPAPAGSWEDEMLPVLLRQIGKRRAVELLFRALTGMGGVANSVYDVTPPRPSQADGSSEAKGVG